MQRLREIINSLTLDAFTLKMIAIIAMVIDHVGYLFFPEIPVFRIIGRLTLPIMAFFIAEGYRRTRNVKKYMIRLGVFAVISMLPYYFVFHHSYFNMLFDLLFGLIAIDRSEKLDREWMKWCVVLCFFVLAVILGTDGGLGVCVLVFLFHKYRDNTKKMTCAMAILYCLQVALLVVIGLFTHNTKLIFGFTTWIRPFALCALFLIFKYNGQKGRNLKYLFYAFYPGHLLILYGVHLLIS